MSTGQASRASVLTSACFRASGASPRHSAIQTELIPDGRRMEYQIERMIDGCVFCKRKVPTRGHHVVPRCKGGRKTAPTCQSCEDFIHKTWSHKECATLSTQSRRSKPIHGFRNSSAGSTSSSQARSSERGETVPGPAGLTVDRQFAAFPQFSGPFNALGVRSALGSPAMGTSSRGGVAHVGHVKLSRLTQVRQ